MAVSKRLRYEVFRRDNFACRYCGATAPDAKLTTDHVTPEALGGTDTPDNLVTACSECNSGKTSSTPNATLVDDVAQDALRWAAAMKQAAQELRAQAEPKRAYRAAFHSAWSEWTWERNGKRQPFQLPANWKTSLDAFREAGLPVEVWPDIVEKAMTNDAVKADNLFRYCCGIAWRMVRELQGRAKAIVGDGSGPHRSIDSVTQAALDVWAEEADDAASDADRQALQESLLQARGRHEAYRLLEGVRQAAWLELTDINEAIRSADHDRVMQHWMFSWLTVDGDYPNKAQTQLMRDASKALLEAGVHVSRVERAATYAGAHHSSRLYFGLTPEELEVTGESEGVVSAAEVWAYSFHATAGRWPTSHECVAFFNSLSRIGRDGDIWMPDIYAAAAAAGAYLDPDITTCLSRRGSVLEMAARPLAADC